MWTYVVLCLILSTREQLVINDRFYNVLNKHFEMY
jgi:hypothetical protein